MNGGFFHGFLWFAWPANWCGTEENDWDGMATRFVSSLAPTSTDSFRRCSQKVFLSCYLVINMDICMGCHPSHWRTHIFQDGYCTTNQFWSFFYAFQRNSPAEWATKLPRFPSTVDWWRLVNLPFIGWFIIPKKPGCWPPPNEKTSTELLCWLRWIWMASWVMRRRKLSSWKGKEHWTNSPTLLELFEAPMNGI